MKRESASAARWRCWPTRSSKTRGASTGIFHFSVCARARSQRIPCLTSSESIDSKSGWRRWVHLLASIFRSSRRDRRHKLIEADEKNQNKVTFKINVQLGREVLVNVDLPEHSSAMKELPKGRLLFYVRFGASRAMMTTEIFGNE
ncbi:MAG: AccI family restriction endonuclease [Burkholderiaceae bacterium]|nr:AccI family restriction endonuclease [Burkholderiaceae bacterium]